MKNQEKAHLIASYLEQLFPNPSIPLHHTNPFTLLIAVLLSAQCTDERVNQVTPTLFAKATTPQAMTKLSLSEVEEILRPCGLYRNKAKAILALSQRLIDHFQGQVPQSLVDLESLPGVGHKTASVVLVQAFSKPAFPVDTHIHRCANRWGLVHSKKVEETEQALKKLFPKKTWGKIHLQMIYYARAYCPARGHLEDKCPICQALKNK